MLYRNQIKRFLKMFKLFQNIINYDTHLTSVSVRASYVVIKNNRPY